jgi:hypothetical protein
MSIPENKSYLSAGLGALSPWGGSRSTTPKSQSRSETGRAVGSDGNALARQQGGDHTVSHLHGISAKRYPKDYPPLNARWFYAADVSVANEHI